MLIGALAGIAAVAAVGFAWLRPGRVFNALVPKDAAGRAVARGIAYGPLPRHRLDVYAPEGGGPARPTLVYFYGGSWASGSRRAYDFVGRALAAQGFVVVIPDYRLYPEVRFPDFLEDCALAVAWAARAAGAFGGDPVRLGLVGHSAGAYNAAMVALDRRWLVAAGASGAVKAWVGLAGPYDFLPIDSPITRRTFGAAPDLAATQPINFVRPDAPPAFVAHGDGDRTVAPQHTATLAALLRAAEVDVVERRYAGVGHLGIVAALARPFRRRVPVLADIVAFLRDRLGP
ncbi:MAG: alpha/beta hydrolase [Bauldia sp.]